MVKGDEEKIAEEFRLVGANDEAFKATMVEISPKKESSIAIIGLGGIGLSALMATKVLNCDPVIAIDISEEKLEMAKLFGASHTINSSKEDVFKRILDITNSLGVDYSIEAAGL